jgi:hypothetical protein
MVQNSLAYERYVHNFEERQNLVFIFDRAQTRDLEILSLSCPLLARRDDVFTSVISIFALHPTIISSHLADSVLLLDTILRCREYSWVQTNEILRFIERVNQFLVEWRMSSYIQTCVKFIISAALSLETILAETTRKIVAFSSACRHRALCESPHPRRSLPSASDRPVPSAA